MHSCSSAALYFKEIGEKYLVKDEEVDSFHPELLEKRRLDHEYFFEEEIEDKDVAYYQDSMEQLEYNQMSASFGNIKYILRLGNIFYFGLRGEKRDLAKAFHYFYQAAEQGDLVGKVNVGIMLVKGMGVEKVKKRIL